MGNPNRTGFSTASSSRLYDACGRGPGHPDHAHILRSWSLSKILKEDNPLVAGLLTLRGIEEELAEFCHANVQHGIHLRVLGDTPPVQGWLEGKELEVVTACHDIDDLREAEKCRLILPGMNTCQGIYAILDEDHPRQDALCGTANGKGDGSECPLGPIRCPGDEDEQRGRTSALLKGE